MVHAMIGLGENVCQPDTGHSSVAEPLAIAMWEQMFVNKLGKAQVLHLMHKERDVIDALGKKGLCLVHTQRLPPMTAQDPNLVYRSGK